MPKIELEIEDYQAPRWGLILLQALVAAIFVVFVVRFWYLQIHRGQDLAREAIAGLPPEFAGPAAQAFSPFIST